MEIKILTKNDFIYYLESLNELFRISFNRNIHPNFLKWRYYDNPCDDLLVAVAIDNNKIIANYSASPHLIENDKTTYKAALSMTTMTHPDYNGLGLFTKLAELLYQEMIRRNYSLIWGFPNNNSHGIFKNKLQWQDIYEIPTFTLNLSTAKMNELDDLYSYGFDNSFDKIVMFSKEKQYQVKKNSAYYKWRYLNNPVNEYYNYYLKDLDVYRANIIYKEYGASIDIVEINGLTDVDKIKLIKNLINIFKEQKKEQINCWLNVNDPLHSAFERIGFTNTMPITYFGARSLDENINIRSYKSWNIFMGDSDVY